MASEINKSHEGTLTTAELVAKIELELGLLLNPGTIRMWTGRDDNPLPVAYRGKNGQAHRFRWVEFLEWYEAYSAAELPSSETASTDPENIDQLDWHNARTISARERAKRDIIETARLAGKYAEVAEMERIAEDRARHAVNLLRTIPSRLAPVLVGKDELEIDRLLDAEIRRVCQRIEEAAQTAIGADLEHTDEAAA